MGKLNLMRWILVSEVPLDERNGAGMRAVLPYLCTLKEGQLSSLYLSEQSHIGMGLQEIQYMEVPYRNRLGQRIPSFFGTLKQIFCHFSRKDHFFVLPNSIRDVVMGLACRLFSPRVTVWVMDDFIETYAWKGRAYRWLCSKIFQLLYTTASQRIVVSQAMSDSYEKTYGKKADAILGRTLSRALPPQVRQKEENLDSREKKLRFVYVGSFIHHYAQPILLMKEILQNSPEALGSIDIQIDLYGMIPPPAEWLLPEKIQYLGAVPSAPPDTLLKTLNSYDYGLIPYQFTTDTERMMSLSFPSKLIDYLGASLPTIIFSPPGLSFLKLAQSKNIGLIFTALSRKTLIQCMQQLSSLDPETYTQWQHNAYRWALEDFLFNSVKINQILYHR